MKKKFLIVLLGLGLLLCIYYFPERDITFFVFQEGSYGENLQEKKVNIFIDGELLFSGEIGYGSLGHQRLDCPLKGGMHSIEVFDDNDEQLFSQTFILLLSESFTVVVYQNDSGNPAIDFQRHISGFMFA